MFYYIFVCFFFTKKNFFCCFLFFSVQQQELDGPPELDPSEIIFDKEKDFIGKGVFGSGKHDKKKNMKKKIFCFLICLFL